jgi:hypothetical protein
MGLRSFPSVPSLRCNALTHAASNDHLRHEAGGLCTAVETALDSPLSLGGCVIKGDAEDAPERTEMQLTGYDRDVGQADLLQKATWYSGE